MATTACGYVAVNFSFDSRTDKVTCTANKDMVIEGENGAQVVLKKGEKFTVVRAASLGENMWYIVRQASGQKKCSCPATKPCRHEKLVVASKTAKSDVEKTTQQTVAKAAVREAEKIVSKPVVAAPTLAKKDRMAAPLNGQRAFSILR